MDVIYLIALAFLAWVVNRGKKQLKALEARLDALQARLKALETAPPAPPPVAEAPPAAEAVADVPMMYDDRGVLIPVPPELLAQGPAAPPPPEMPDEAAVPPPPPPPPPAPPARPKLEELLTVRWSVWLGAATIGLAGVFMVRYSIEQGLLGPTVRIVLGLLLGLGLVGGAEWLRRRQKPLGFAGGLPQASITAALAAGGIVALYAALYAGYGLYDLYGPLAAFGSLVVVSSAALSLSLLHGPLLAVIGLVGALLVPGLVSSDSSSAWTLFTYLLIVVAAATVLARHRGWGWAGWIAAGGTIWWSLVWMVFAWQERDGLPVGLFLAGCTALFAIGLADLPLRLPGNSPSADRVLALAPPAAMAFLAFALVRFAAYDAASLTALLVIAGLLMARVRWREDDAALLPVVLLVVLAVQALWHLPAIVEQPEAIGLVEGRPAGFMGGSIVPPSLERFLGWTLAFASFLGGGAFAAMRGARRPGVWAALMVAAPIALYVVAYWRIENLQTSLPWAAVAIALAGLYLALASRLTAMPGMNAPLGAFAVGCTLGVTLALATALRDGWLTVAFSVELPVLAWIAGRLDLAPIRRVAMLLAGIVLVRLLANPEVLDYRLGHWPILNGLLYTYGVPAIAFAAAAWMFARTRRDLLVHVLEGGVLAFLSGLVTLNIRLGACSGLATCDAALGETGGYTLAWAGMAYLLYRAVPLHPTPVVRAGWPILAMGALAMLLLGGLLADNPLFSRIPVGTWPVFNLLMVAYGLPAVVAALFLRTAWLRGESRLATVAGGIALTLGLIYISFEVRRAFHGTYLHRFRVEDAEWYAYSAAWLAYGGVLLGLGVWTGLKKLRYASLGVIVLVIAKVFLLDMDALTGLWRALSFLGLGLCLIGIGWLYQRFVFPAGRSS